MDPRLRIAVADVLDTDFLGGRSPADAVLSAISHQPTQARLRLTTRPDELIASRDLAPPQESQE